MWTRWYREPFANYQGPPNSPTDFFGNRAIGYRRRLTVHPQNLSYPYSSYLRDWYKIKISDIPSQPKKYCNDLYRLEVWISHEIRFVEEE
jgi:hypothetical protein